MEKIRDTDLIVRLPLTDRGLWQVFLTSLFVLICDTNGINSVCFRLSLLFYLLDESVKRLTMAFGVLCVWVRDFQALCLHFLRLCDCQSMNFFHFDPFRGT